jgi:dUTP pyrophosphatase
VERAEGILCKEEHKVISHDELLIYLNNKPHLVEYMINPATQVQQNGIELTLKHVEVFEGSGAVAFDNSERQLPAVRQLEFESDGWIYLPKGVYKIVFNEIVTVPKNMAAIAKMRSSVMRCGVTIETGVWDAGYSGRSEGLMLVHNEMGFKVKRNARIIQMLFFKLDKEVSEGYSGRYQNENTKDRGN